MVLCGRSFTASLGTVLGLLCAATRALPDVPSPENYIRRSGVAATVLGNYVYMDGGEISQIAEGETEPGPSNEVNSTLVIDISHSWDTSTVEFRSIPKPGPRKAAVVLWTDPEENSFYSWGGKWVFGRNMTEDAMWKFTADGRGGGSWEMAVPENPALFDTLSPSEKGAHTVVNKTGFHIGGQASGWTEYRRGATQSIPGMVTYDMSTKVWQNATTTEFSPVGGRSLIGAWAEYVPMFGPNGLVLVMGGIDASVTNEDTRSVPPFEFTNVTLFDPKTRKSWVQQTTGHFPPAPRYVFCAVGFKTPEGGYDIFMFGGRNRRDEISYQDAYLLSLPGFVWTKLPDSEAGRRQGNSCVAVGNRQVLSIGGGDSWNEKDPAPQGLLIFDVTDMAWRNTYNASAEPYQRPEPVRNWYANGSLDTVQWSSPELQTMFATTSSPSEPAPPSDSSKPADPTSQPADGGPPIGAIVGGVLGALVLVALVVLAWWMIRRRRQRAVMQTPMSAYYTQAGVESPPPAPAGGYYNVVDGKVVFPVSEIDGQRSHSELPDNVRSELSGVPAPVAELYGDYSARR